MTNLSIGDRVAYQGRAYLVDGFSPMGVTPSLILLRDPSSRCTLEVPLAELGDRGDDGQSGADDSCVDVAEPAA